jgi:catechol 2,3-dioxygenase-like lactoylglutathione lyase family enzyme
MRPVLTHIALSARDLEQTVAFYQSFCALGIVHDRGERADRVVWLAEPGREKTLILVLMQGNAHAAQHPEDYSHLGFALASRAEVDAIAERAREAGCLAWPPRQERFPVGYYCGVRDPDGNVVEFSYGQPLGPGADDAS